MSANDGKHQQTETQDYGYERAKERHLKRNQCAKGSLQAMIRKHPSLWTHPLLWGYKHIDALDCTFGEAWRQNSKSSPRSMSEVEIKLDEDLTRALSSLHLIDGRADKDIATRDIVRRMASLFLPEEQISHGTLPLHYAGRKVALLHLPLIGFENSDIPWAPIWVYIDESCIEAQLKRYRPGPIRPLCIAIFLAVAQNKKRIREINKDRSSDYNQKITLFTPFYSNLGMYTTYISDEYLQKLEKPREFFDVKLEIQRRVIIVNSERPKELYLAMQQACLGEVEKDGPGSKPSTK